MKINKEILNSKFLPELIHLKIDSLSKLSAFFLFFLLLSFGGSAQDIVEIDGAVRLNGTLFVQGPGPTTIRGNLITHQPKMPSENLWQLATTLSINDQNCFGTPSSYCHNLSFKPVQFGVQDSGKVYRSSLGEFLQPWSRVYTESISLGKGLGDQKLILYESSDFGNSYGMGVQAGSFKFHLGNPQANYRFFDDLGGTEIFTIMGNGTVKVNGTTVHTSDRNSKEDISLIDSGEVLKKIQKLPIYSWKYKSQSINHVGPMAQDFYQAFGLGLDDKTISSVDMDGVALAAIKELGSLVIELQLRIKILEEQMATGKSRKRGKAK